MKIGGDRIILLAIGFEKVLRIIASLEVEPKPYGTPPFISHKICIIH